MSSKITKLIGRVMDYVQAHEGLRIVLSSLFWLSFLLPACFICALWWVFSFKFPQLLDACPNTTVPPDAYVAEVKGTVRMSSGTTCRVVDIMRIEYHDRGGDVDKQHRCQMPGELQRQRLVTVVECDDARLTK